MLLQSMPRRWDWNLIHHQLKVGYINSSVGVQASPGKLLKLEDSASRFAEEELKVGIMKSLLRRLGHRKPIISM